MLFAGNSAGTCFESVLDRADQFLPERKVSYFFTIAVERNRLAQRPFVRSGTLPSLIAIRREDRTWVKGYKNAVDTLGPWEKRAGLFSSVVLSKDERRAWMRVAAQRGERLEVAVSKFVVAAP